MNFPFLVGCWLFLTSLPPVSIAAEEPDPRLRHWSVQPLPTDFAPGASIDGFIDATLREHGFARSPEADSRTLIRRLHVDLVGLPPEPETVERFVSGAGPTYHDLVEELLASPHHGERWARHWLDIAHYADTHGFERDQLRPHAWRYRDYVIQSLNEDKPYDRFLREQIAADVLPDAPPLDALGFLAAGPWDFVGQVETKSPELKRAARALDLDDMVTQVLTASMGVTIHCARCHDHKLDPISQEEYFRLSAVFAGVKRGDRDANPAETTRLAAEKDRLDRELAALRTEIRQLAGEGLSLAGLLPPGTGIDPRDGKLTTAKLGYHPDLPVNQPRPVEAIPAIRSVFVPDGDAPDGPLPGLPPTSGHAWDAIRHGPLNAQRTTTIQGTDYAAAGHDLLGLHANSAITFDLGVLRQDIGHDTLRLTGMIGFGASPEAAASRAGFSVYLDAEPVLQRLTLRKDESAALDVPVPATASTLTLVATDGGDGISHDLLFLGDPRLVPDSSLVLTKADAGRLEQLRARATQLESEQSALPEAPKVYAIVSDAAPPIVRVQRRGNPEDEAGEVTPGAFTWVHHASADFGGHDTPEARRRLALAEWITHPDNPLTPRVIVNRLWHHHFGQGLVATPSDFGLAGDPPSHPELLDFLARELVTHGWSLKHIHRLIVTSATYRQTSLGSNPADQSNRLLGHQNPKRLDAETLRDSVLAVSGRLNREMGGPGFRDFLYTEAYAPIYEYITPDRPELWRRSIYRFIVRTTPHQFLTTLDCPDPATFTPARARTTTALQALALSHNEFMLQQARYLADRVAGESGSPDAAVRRTFQLCFLRNPTDAELAAARPLDPFTLCRLLLNANEFVHLD